MKKLKIKYIGGKFEKTSCNFIFNFYYCNNPFIIHCFWGKVNESCRILSQKIFDEFSVVSSIFDEFSIDFW